MEQPRRPFTVVDETPDPAAPPQGIDQFIAPPKQPFIERASVDMLKVALAALGQRAVIAMAALFTLITVASAFYLWMLVMEAPTQLQIIAATIYSMFILAINYLNMRRLR